MRRFIVGITGASGSIYGVRLIEALLTQPDHEVHLIMTPAGVRVLAQEMGARPRLSPFEASSFLNLSQEQAARLVNHPHGDIGAGPASGTFPFEAMIVCPCSVKTLGALATGMADNLLTRAADVALKEGRRLVLAPRETPHSLIHLRNMVKLAEAGAVILPTNPAFYHHPRTIEDLVRYVVQKILDRLGLQTPYQAIRWGGGEQ